MEIEIIKKTNKLVEVNSLDIGTHFRCNDRIYRLINDEHGNKNHYNGNKMYVYALIEKHNSIALLQATLEVEPLRNVKLIIEEE